MIPLIRKPTDLSMHTDIDRFSKKGIHSIAIAKKELQGDDVIDFLRMLNENQSTSYKDNSALDQMLIQVA